MEMVITLRVTESQLKYLLDLARIDEGENADAAVHYDSLVGYLEEERLAVDGPNG